MKRFTLVFNFLVSLSLCITACRNISDIVPEFEAQITTQSTQERIYTQAPSLDEMDLPPVNERLPDEPVIVQPYESIGQYGGTWNTVSWEAGLPNIKMIFYDPPIRWKPDYSGYEVGLAESYEFNADGTQLTYKLRPGLKWSDGAPYTTADWDFWWNDLAMNENYKGVSVPWWARNEDGTPFTIQFPDEYTIVMTWDTPRWTAPYIFAQGYWEWEPLMKPVHFLKQYHPEYEGDDYETLRRIDRWWETPGYPTIFAWVCDEVIPGKGTTFFRNPYYWKVDPAGQQLPYIDYIMVEIQQDEEVRVLYTAQGKYDAVFRATSDPRNIPFLQQHAEENGYHIQSGWMKGAGAWPGWLVNQYYVGEECGWQGDGSVDAAECRSLLSDTNFLKGLSVALDRERILDEVWDGIGYKSQATISPQSWHFSRAEGKAKLEEWKTADEAYNTDFAEDYFKAAGFIDLDGDGWRDLPNGEKFTLVIDLNTWGGEQVRNVADQIAKESWEAVGIHTMIKNVQNQPGESERANLGLFMVRGIELVEMDFWTAMGWVFPIRNGVYNPAIQMQSLWYNSDPLGSDLLEEGSPAKRLQALYNQFLAEPDVEKRHEIVWEAIDININSGPFFIGATGDQPMPVVVRDGFHNVSAFGILGPWSAASPGNQHPETYWTEEKK